MRQVRLVGWLVYWPFLGQWIATRGNHWEPTAQTKRIPIYAYDHQGD
jgi:hypothetical protein